MHASTVPYLELVLAPAASVAAVRETSILFTVGLGARSCSTNR